MALRTIGIDPGAHPVLDWNSCVSDRDGLQESRDVILIRGRVEHTDVSKGAELVIRATGRWIGEVSIQLVGLYPEDIACRSSMTDQTLTTARITPSLNACATSACRNRNIFVERPR